MTHPGLTEEYPKPRPLQGGFTLVELLVALAISTVIGIAAISALVVSRQGFVTADTSSQLRDNVRYTSDLIQRLGVQSGFKDIAYATTTRFATETQDPTPNITGYNNAAVDGITDPQNSTTARTTGSLGFGSDILILRYQSGETFSESGVSDRSMIDCNGVAAIGAPGGRDDRIVSILHVADGVDGEPTLMCTTQASAGTWYTQPIVSGVENFQVLYGLDTVSTGAVADTYRRADQITTNADWRRVRSLRIGMVVRGSIGSAPDSSTLTYYPLGMSKESDSGTKGFAMSTTDAASAGDKGTRFTPAADNRMRQVATFTVHLRNSQGL